tara:strand:- start:13374 stop:14069 length:696 start_codon:yes stop_codon:yes gene_type:complete
MTTITKKKKAIKAKLQPGQLYSLSDAVALLKSFASKKFSEAVDIAVNLGLDSRKSDQMVRGATSLPKGTGKTVRVAVFAQGDNAVKAKEAGADIVGFEDLAEQIKSGDMPFDVVIATPDSMRIVGQLGQILGPRGLMPNPKVGTVTMNVAAAVADVKSGQVRYRTDKNGIIHCSVGKIEFSESDLAENIVALLADLKKAKPIAAKGVYIRKLTLSTTMGPGIALDISSVFV